METTTFPVMHFVDEHYEATGHTLRFCSERCRMHFQPSPELDGKRFQHGQESLLDLPDSEQCSTCGQVLS